jgi:hypothetical protein
MLSQSEGATRLRTSRSTPPMSISANTAERHSLEQASPEFPAWDSHQIVTSFDFRPANHNGFTFSNSCVNMRSNFAGTRFLPGWMCIIKWQAKVVLVLISVVAILASAQSPTGDRSQAQETQVRGYWIDRSTGVTSAGKDNGRDVTWNKAMKYCRDLRLAGYSDWRLATLEELEGIYDKDANASGRAGPGTGRPFTFHVKGNLFLTGNQWSSSRVSDNRGHLIGYAWRFDFNEGKPFDGDELWFYTNKRALCVRSSEK